AYVQPINFKPDNEGKWTLEGLKPGKWNLVGVGTWDVVGPKELTVPLDAPVKLTVRKVQLLNLTGHVLTKDHKPLAGVRIKAYLQIPEGANSYRGDLQELTTDAKGQYTVENLRSDYKISLSTTMPGYNYVSGGTVTQKDNAFSVQDMVLVPLTAKIEGRVVDAAGKPVAGAQVMSPNGDVNLQVPSDATGKFVLTSLPAGQVMVVGGVKDRIGEARDVDGSKPLTLTVNPVKPLPGNDVQRAYDILDELWATTEGGKYYRDNIPTAIAPYNPDLAVKLASRKDGSIDDGILSNIITTFAKANPTRAGDWAPPKMEQIKDKRIAFSAWITFAINIAAKQPDLAKQYYQKAKDYDKEETAKNAKDQQSILSRIVPLARLARKLGLNDEAEQYIQTALTIIKGMKDPQQWTLAGVATLEYDQTAKLIDGLPTDQRKQALQQAVTQTAAYDTKLARRWLDKLKEVEKADPNTGSYSGYAAQTLIQVMGKTDPAGALELARSVTEMWSKPADLALAAQYQTKEVALQVLREAGDIANGQQYGSAEPIARVAALTYELDPKMGMEFFNDAKDHWEAQKAQRENQMWYAGNDGTAEFAFYYSRIDPAASRLILESEFARQLQAPKGDDSYQRSYTIRSIVMAMAAIDVDRALEMSFLMPPPDKGQEWNNPQAEAQRSIAQYILLPETDRHTKQFQQWDVVNGWD
ncbi:MAG: carboxypeptidase regulatory-like domain-containing protein, partial [Abitibacteriaceae bacterium]|nr:carboxypeptidase regulatory-like domain-containing protein [Abditibacteriaceae bacterium]